MQRYRNFSQVLGTRDGVSVPAPVPVHRHHPLKSVKRYKSTCSVAGRVFGLAVVCENRPHNMVIADRANSDVGCA